VNQYFFQELCPHVQDELIKLALENAGHYQHALPPRQDLLEDIDHYLNCHNYEQSIPEWFQTVQMYEAWNRPG
jgi:hypothetical protein